MDDKRRPVVAVVGGSRCTPEEAELAREVGRLLAEAGAAVVCGGCGTLSEIALALRLGKPVIGLGTWEFRGPSGGPDPVLRVGTAAEAVRLALQIGPHA